MNATFSSIEDYFPVEIAKEDFPFVSVIMPVFNEEKFIERSLVAVLEQDYPSDKLEIIVADGMSSDQTREIVRFMEAHFPNVRLIDNPERIVPTGLNRAIAAARGEIIVRLDGHCEYPKNYVRKVVELRQELGADTVGGVLVPTGLSYAGKSVAAAYHSPIGLGSTALKASEVSERVREVDTVHGGCWKRERLLAVGGFDEEMVRNQDDELSFRLRKNSGKIFQTLAVPVKYHVRDSFKKLFLQFAQYGYWKVRVVRKHPQQASPRHVVPALLVLTIFTTAILGLFFQFALWAFVGFFGFYFATVAMVSGIQAWRGEKRLWPGIVFALMAIHFGYGIGFILGCARAAFGQLPTDKIFERVTR